jgi:hypothetical protein
MESASFPLLPTEIRLQIWRNAIPEGRFIWVETSGSVDANYSTGEFTIGTLSPTCTRVHRSTAQYKLCPIATGAQGLKAL